MWTERGLNAWVQPARERHARRALSREVARRNQPGTGGRGDGAAVSRTDRHARRRGGETEACRAGPADAHLQAAGGEERRALPGPGVNGESAARPALYTFDGDVYAGLQGKSLDAAGVAFAQDHVRILSGLYGVLRPLDLMSAYRLEMGTPLKLGRKTGLYRFWGKSIAEALADDLSGHRDRTLINLASKEYFEAVDVAALPGPVLAIDFRDEHAGGELRFNTFVAKRARGAMARFMIDERLETPEGLKAFDGFGYKFRADLSDEARWSFVRPAA